jgi:hypothetical protein
VTNNISSIRTLFYATYNDSHFSNFGKITLANLTDSRILLKQVQKKIILRIKMA